MTRRRASQGVWTAEPWGSGVWTAEPWGEVPASGGVALLRLPPATWQGDHRSLLDGTYGSTLAGLWVAVGGAYVRWTHDRGDGVHVGRNPGAVEPALSGLTGHVVELGPGSHPAADVVAESLAALGQLPGVTSVVDLEDGTVELHGITADDVTIGGAFAARSGGGVMGVQTVSVAGGTGGLAQPYVGRLVVPASPGSGPRLPLVVRVWVEVVDLADAPRLSLWRGDEDGPTDLVHDLGQLPVATIVAPGWCDLWMPSEFAGTYATGEYLYLLITATANLTHMSYPGAGAAGHTWDGGYGVRPVANLDADPALPPAAEWVGDIGGTIPIVWPVAIVWADTDALVGDGSLVRVWGSPPSTPIGDFGSQVAIPEAIVHMIAPAPQILGLVLGRAYVGVGSQTSSGTVRTTAWTGDVSLLDASYPHYPTTTGLVAVHDYGTETTVAPESWHVLDTPESDVPIVPGQALAISIHGLGGGTMIRFDQTGAGEAAFANTLRNPARAFDWYPMSGGGPEDSGGSEVEAHHPDSPVVFGDGNPSIVVDPSLPATTPHAQDDDDRRPGNVPAVALELLVRGASVT